MAAGLVAACSSGGKSSGSGTTTVTYGFSAAVASFLPAWIAGEQPSICKPFGIKIKPVALNHDAAITALISNSVKLSETSSASVLQAGAKGSASLQAVALTGPKASGLFATKDITSPAQFKDKTISATSMGSTSDTQIRLELKDAGLMPDQDYKIAYTSSQNAMVALAVTGKAAGFPMVPPTSPAAEKAGFHQILGNPPEGSPLNLVSRDAIAVNPSYANSHKQVITNALKCIDAAIDYIGSHQTERDAALVKYMSIRPDTAESTYETNKLTYQKLEPFTSAQAQQIVGSLTDVAIFKPDTFSSTPVDKILNSSFVTTS